MPHKEYVYQIWSRTLSNVQVNDEYSGIKVRAILTVRPESENKLTAKITDLAYAEVHMHINDEWDSYIPAEMLTFHSIPFIQEPFHILLRDDGSVEDLIVAKEVHNMDANLLKAIISQLQITQGEKRVKSYYNLMTDDQTNSTTYEVMEASVTGIFETLYDIHPFHKIHLLKNPELAPLAEQFGDADLIEIVKSKNFSNHKELVEYHYGFDDFTESEPATNVVEDFFSRSSVSQIIATGNVNHYTIQSSVTTNKISVRPLINSEKHAFVVSRINLTLVSLEESSHPFPEPSPSTKLGSLVYQYESPFQRSSAVKSGRHFSAEDISFPFFSSEEDQHLKINNVHARHHRSAELSSSEEQPPRQDQPPMELPPDSPLLPLFVGYKGRSIKSSAKVDVVSEAHKLAMEIASSLETPNEIPEKRSLEKYILLESILRIMDKIEMEEASNKLESEKSAWKVYRDAVADVGTGPALETISHWIKSKKIDKFETFSVINSMIVSTRHPTHEYMKKFYELLTHEVVHLESPANYSSIIFYSNLVRKVYVQDVQSENRYPVHVYGQFHTKEGEEFVTNEYIPYLSKKLEEAVHEADSHKILVYIRALGNVGHRKILETFEPYLEHKIHISQFQRLYMVSSLNELVCLNSEVAQAVLYRIYQNTNEDSKIRVLCVYQLMNSNPPASVVHRLAEYTHMDSDPHVNAAIHDSIRAVAQLEGHEFEDR